MSSLFSSVKMYRPKKNKFDLSFTRKQSMDMGKLYPCYIQEVVPGDSFRVRAEIMLRFAPLISPVMHQIDVWTHYFFVPNRLLWEDWEDFITGGPDGDLNPVPPQILIDSSTPASQYNNKSLADYLGFYNAGSAPAGANEARIAAMPFAAYQLIWKEYFTDQNILDLSTLLPEFPLPSGDLTGTDRAQLTQMRRRAWEKDYFTSALPWTQRGSEVLLPSEMSVTYKNISELLSGAGAPVAAGTLENTAGSDLQVNTGGGNVPARIENIDSITNATTTINDLRRSVRLQEWLEKNARGGSRYIEQILSHFGVKSSDARLQRPEFLGGNKAPVVISEVLSTAQTEPASGEVPVGELAGHGISVGSSDGFQRSFEEHGFIVGVMSIRPRTGYADSVHRMFHTRNDRFDYYWPEFANIGEQAVYNKELVYDANDQATNDTVFGYQSRYAEYKYNPDTVHGAFRTSLDFWHMARKFTVGQALNGDFIFVQDLVSQGQPLSRIFALTEEADEQLYCQIYYNISAIRPMPYFGTPML